MSLSDVSDLTDLSSEEDDVPLARRSSKAKKAPKEYKVTHVLRAPRTVQYTAKCLYDQIIDNAIDLDPEYQRDVVWQEEKQSGLIDSILRNYYIPPIIFAVTIQDDGSELRTCIDGKQRLTSIQRFIDGHIPHKDSFTNEKLWFKSSATNARRKLLSQHLRTQFANKQIVCVEYTGLDDDQEREIFQRVQLGVALTPAERLQALVGPWPATIREVQNQALGEEGFEGYLDWGHARGRDFQCLATIGYLIENHPKTTVPGTKTLEKWLQKSQPVPNQLRADLHETFRIFVTLARDKKYSGSLNRPTRVSPIEFVMIGVLIYLKRQTLSLTQISSAIEKMRKDVRASHQDIRSNTRVTKHLTEFMAKKIKVSELRSDGEGDKPAATAIKAIKPAKRKRPVYSDDSDSEPAPKAKPPKPATKSTPGSSVPKVNGTAKTPAASTSKHNPTTKPSQSSSRTTNNSLSNLFPPPETKTTLPAPATQKSAPPPPQSPSNGHNKRPGPTTLNSAHHAPLTVQTGSTVKVESPQIGSLNSPAALSAIDRLAPIRAAKASLASGVGVQSPVSRDGETRAMPSSGPNTAQTPVDSRQNPVAPQSRVYQTTALSQQQLPSVQSSSQQLPANLGQGRSNSTLEGVLQALRDKFPQLANPAQGTSNDGVNSAPLGQNARPSRFAGHPVMPPSMPGPGNTSGPNNLGHAPQGYHPSLQQGTFNGGMSSTQPNPNQASGPFLLPPWPSSGMGSQQQQQPTMSFSMPNSAGLHSLPQRPDSLPQRPVAAQTARNNSMRGEPLGPTSRSTSSESAIPDGRRGSYSHDRPRPPDDRQSHGYDRHHGNRHSRNRYYGRS